MPILYPQVMFTRKQKVYPGSIYPQITKSDTQRMKMEVIYATRLARFRQLMTDRFDGKQAAIADAVGKPANYVSRILKGSKKLGEELVREFEETLGLPAYWFDGIDSAAQWPFSAPLSKYQDLDAAQKRELDTLVRGFIAGASSPKSDDDGKQAA